MRGVKIVRRKDMPLGSRPLRRGMEGNDVRQAESLLKKLGLYRGDEDGKYGLLMEEAAFDLQKALYLPRNGRIDRFLLQRLGGNVGMAWHVYRAASGESEKEIAEKYEISPEAVRNRIKNHQRPTEDRIFLIPQKNLWIWEDESRPALKFSKLLCRKSGEGGNSNQAVDDACVVYRLNELEIQGGVGKVPILPREWILDLRLEEPKSIRKAIQRYAGKTNGWFWLKDRLFDIGGIIHYLKLDKLTEQNGLIIELNPPLSNKDKRKMGEGRPFKLLDNTSLMYSVNLSPRVYINNEEKIISQKEGRLWLNRRLEKIKRYEGLVRWAVTPVQYEGNSGLYCVADLETMRAIYRRVLSTQCSGVILEGTTGFDPRLIDLRREYFALKKSGHEMTVRDIYLKREKMPGLNGHHGAAGR